MQISESTIRTRDNLKLYTKSWSIENPRAVVAIVHGFGEHCNRYNHVADFFTKSNLSVIAYDRRGHGKSEGKRGHFPTYQSILDEVDLLLKKCRTDNPSKSIILYGHSQGGNIVLNYLLQKKQKLSKDLPIAIVTGAWIRLGFVPPKLKVMAGKLLANILPAFPQPNELDINHLSRDLKVVRGYEKDSLVHSVVTFKCGVEMLKSGEQLEAYKGEFPIPLLMVHGAEDKVISPEGSRIFSSNVTGDITLEILPDQYHEVHNEPEKEALFNLLLRWINSKLQS